MSSTPSSAASAFAAFFGAKDVQTDRRARSVSSSRRASLTDAFVDGFNRANLFGAAAPQP